MCDFFKKTQKAGQRAQSEADVTICDLEEKGKTLR